MTHLQITEEIVPPAYSARPATHPASLFGYPAHHAAHLCCYCSPSGCSCWIQSSCLTWLAVYPARLRYLIVMWVIPPPNKYWFFFYPVKYPWAETWINNRRVHYHVQIRSKSTRYIRTCVIWKVQKLSIMCLNMINVDTLIQYWRNTDID